MKMKPDSLIGARLRQSVEAGKTNCQQKSRLAPWRLAVKGLRERRVAETPCEIALVPFPDLPNVLPQFRLHRFGKHRPPVFASLAVANNDDVVAPVEILDVQCRHSSSRSPAPYCNRAISR